MTVASYGRVWSHGRNVGFITIRGEFRPPRGAPLDEVVRTRRPINIVDLDATDVGQIAAKLDGARSLLSVSMLKDDELLARSQEENRTFPNRPLGREYIESQITRSVLRRRKLP
jgi:hypothetical protein